MLNSQEKEIKYKKVKQTLNMSVHHTKHLVDSLPQAQLESTSTLGNIIKKRKNNLCPNKLL